MGWVPDRCIIMQTPNIPAIQTKLYKGNLDIVQRESATSLFSPEIRSIKARGFDQRWCANAARIRGLPFEIMAQREE